MIVKEKDLAQFSIGSKIKKYLYSTSQRNIILISMILLCLSVYSVFLLYSGMRLQKTQTAAKLQDVIYGALATKLSIIPNYLDGLMSNPKLLSVDIKFKELQKLNYARNNALERGMIVESDKAVDAKAIITVDGDEYKVKLSPTGQNLDMIGAKGKRALKVKVKGGRKIFGMKEFKLLPPQSRHHLTELIGHALEEDEGLISLRYFFVDVEINGESNGIYALEEHFNKELLEHRKAREGLLFSFAYNATNKSDSIKIFNRKVLKDSHSNAQFRILSNKWHAFKNGDMPLERVFDIKQYAKYYAIIDLMNGYHAAYFQNLKMYYNPITQLIEPITREYNSMRYSDGNRSRTPLMIQNKDAVVGVDSWNLLASRFFSHKRFIEYYMIALTKISTNKYLDEFFDKHEIEIEKELSIIHKSEPYYSFPKEYLYSRQNYISEWLAEELNVVVYINTDSEKALQFQVINYSDKPITLLSYKHEESSDTDIDNYLLLPKESYEILDTTVVKYGHQGYQLKYKSLYGDDIYAENMIPRSFSANIVMPNFIYTHSSTLIDYPGLIIDESTRSISISERWFDISSNLIIPEGYTFILKEGQTLNLSNGASILSYSPVIFRGTNAFPVSIVSEDSSGQGIIILASEGTSKIENVIFNHLANPKYKSWSLPAAITVYRTNVVFNKVKFLNNKSEDYLNVVRSTFTLTESFFGNTQSDAFDSDYSNGLIEDCQFDQCGNDAIDISGSHLSVKNIVIGNIGDKGVSVGENSVLNGNNINISNSELGLVSKDMSIIKIDSLSLYNCKVGILAYQKKPEYGPGKIWIQSLKSTDIGVNYLVESGSFVEVEGSELPAKGLSLKDILYGVKYGINSKD
jgi:hypothetical protein